jgi:Domain of unknown function (DUF4249)
MKKINIVIITLLSVASFFLLNSCETEFDPDIKYTPRLSAEAYIEGGDRSTPPYLILTRSLDFFSLLNPADYEKYLVHDAKVTVTDGTLTDTLTEICLKELTPQQKQLAGQFLGINIDSLDGVNANICIYTSLNFKVLGQEGKTYSMRIEADGQVLTATTTIPRKVPLDSLVLRNLPDEKQDTLRQMRGFLSDPGSEKNYYRYQVSINDGSFRARSNSVVNDDFFDGKPSFEFPLPKPFLPNQENIDFETVSYYKVGEKATIKWMSIDAAHYRFWLTAEANAQNVGPFSTYTKVTSNVNGGLGIFGGICSSYYTITIK